MQVANRYSGVGLAMSVAIGAIAATPAVADIDLALVPVNSVVSIGDTVQLQVFVLSDTGASQLMSAMQMIFSWETPYLQLMGVNDTGAVPLLSSGFPANDPYGINESVPPQNGLGLYQAWAPLGDPVAATPGGTLLTTLEFLALAPTSATLIDVLESAGDPVGHTIIFDGTVPNLDVTGTLTGAVVTIVPGPGVLAVLLAGCWVTSRRKTRD